MLRKKQVKTNMMRQRRWIENNIQLLPRQEGKDNLEIS